MKLFFKILLAIFFVSISIPFLYTSLVYQNYWTILPSLLIYSGSLIFLGISALLLTIFDKKSKRRFFYIVISLLAIGLFILTASYQYQISGYIFIKKNESSLEYIISEMRDKRINYVYYKEDSERFSKIKSILSELEIQSAQLTPDNSVLFMEGGFMEADGWCYSETDKNPEKYYDRGSDRGSYQIITFWKHHFDHWYRWNCH